MCLRECFQGDQMNAGSSAGSQLSIHKICTKVPVWYWVILIPVIGTGMHHHLTHIIHKICSKAPLLCTAVKVWALHACGKQQKFEAWSTGALKFFFSNAGIPPPSSFNVLFSSLMKYVYKVQNVGYNSKCHMSFKPAIISKGTSKSSRMRHTCWSVKRMLPSIPVKSRKNHCRCHRHNSSGSTEST